MAIQVGGQGSDDGGFIIGEEPPQLFQLLFAPFERLRLLGGKGGREDECVVVMVDFSDIAWPVEMVEPGSKFGSELSDRT